MFRTLGTELNVKERGGLLKNKYGIYLVVQAAIVRCKRISWRYDGKIIVKSNSCI